MQPQKIIATRLLFWAQAMTVTPSLLLIRPERANDKALLAHEAEHARQMRAEGVLRFWFMYVFSREFRLDAELEAYRVQIAAGGSQELCAQALATKYFLGITVAQARELLA